MLKLDWGDSQVWMTVAVQLHSNKRTARAARKPHHASISYRYPKENELNVAYVCAGYAFEFLFKALVKLSGKQPIPKHEPSVAFGNISQKYRVPIEQISQRNGWRDINELLKFLDESLCHADRKYWGQSPKGSEAHVVFHVGGRRSMNALCQLHEELSDFALDAINDDLNVEEIWAVSKAKRSWLVDLT